MIQVKCRSTALAFSALVALFSLGFILFYQGTTHSQSAPGGEARNMRLVGYHDLQGRESLEVVTRYDAANGDWVYVGHSNNYWGDTEGHMNSITGRGDYIGVSFTKVADPKTPKLVWHIQNKYSANPRHVSVVYDYQGTGRD